MPRRRLIQTSRYPYHVFSRSNNKEWFYIPIEECWTVFCNQLSDSSIKCGAEIFAFTLMPNHFHLILSTPLENLGEVMRHLLTGVSKAIQQRAQRINHIFGSRYRWTLMRDSYSVAYVYKYVLRNPVRGGLAANVREYPFSSANEKALRRLPLVDSLEMGWKQVPRNWEERLSWLNQPTPKELENLIAQGLRRETFKLTEDNSRQKQLRALKHSYGIEPETSSPQYERDLSSLKGD